MQLLLGHFDCGKAWSSSLSWFLLVTINSCGFLLYRCIISIYYTCCLINDWKEIGRSYPIYLWWRFYISVPFELECKISIKDKWDKISQLSLVEIFHLYLGIYLREIRLSSFQVLIYYLRHEICKLCQILNIRVSDILLPSIKAFHLWTVSLH